MKLENNEKVYKNLNLGIKSILLKPLKNLIKNQINYLKKEVF